MKVAIDAVGIKGHGGAAVLCELLTWLPIARPDWKWHLFLLARRFREFDDPPVAANVTIECTERGNSGIGRLYWIYRELPRRLASVKADLLLALANIGSGRPGLPQVVYCHQPNAFILAGREKGMLSQRLRLRIMRELILSGARRSAAIVVQTDAMRENMGVLDPTLRHKIYVVPSGYRTITGSRDLRADKESLIDTCPQPRLIYVSHPGEYKNHDTLVRAMPYIVEAFPSAHLLLTLEESRFPSATYARLIQTLKRIIRDEHMEAHIRWLGILKPDEVAYAFSASSLSICPSLSESFGLPIAEAMAAGCPIAAADLPYAHEVASSAAQYFNPHEPKALAQCVISILKDPELHVQLKSSAVDRSRMFSYEHIGPQLASILETASQTKAPANITPPVNL